MAAAGRALCEPLGCGGECTLTRIVIPLVAPARGLDQEDMVRHFWGGVVSSLHAEKLVLPLKGTGSLNGRLVQLSWMWLQGTA